jgi:hypothetical protein
VQDGRIAQSRRQFLQRPATLDLIRERPRPAYRAQRQRGIEVRENIAAAGALPFELCAQCVRIDGDQDQVGLPGKMLCRGLGKLGRGGKMNEAVTRVDGRSVKLTSGLSGPPQGLFADFVNRHHQSAPNSPLRAISARYRMDKFGGAARGSGSGLELTGNIFLSWGETRAGAVGAFAGRGVNGDAHPCAGVVGD